MGLEAATLIHELDPANPVGGADPKGQGDDHIRMLKNVLLNTFPNVEAALAATHTQLDKTTLLNALTAFDLNSFVPTLTQISNATGIANGFHRYIRFSDLVLVIGAYSCNCNVGQSTVSVSLPVASNFSSSVQAAGGGGAIGANVASVYIGTAFASSDQLLVHFVSGGVASFFVNYLAVYPILS